MWELLNGFAPNLQGRRAWSLARRNLNVKVKGQGVRRTPYAANDVMQKQKTPFRRRRGVTWWR